MPYIHVDDELNLEPAGAGWVPLESRTGFPQRLALFRSRPRLQAGSHRWPRQTVLLPVGAVDDHSRHDFTEPPSLFLQPNVLHRHRWQPAAYAVRARTRHRASAELLVVFAPLRPVAALRRGIFAAQDAEEEPVGRRSALPLVECACCLSCRAIWSSVAASLHGSSCTSPFAPKDRRLVGLRSRVG